MCRLARPDLERGAANVCVCLCVWCVLCACVRMCTYVVCIVCKPVRACVCMCVWRGSGEGHRPYLWWRWPCELPSQHYHIALARFKGWGDSGPRRMVAETFGFLLWQPGCDWWDGWKSGQVRAERTKKNNFSGWAVSPGDSCGTSKCMQEISQNQVINWRNWVCREVCRDRSGNQKVLHAEAHSQ